MKKLIYIWLFVIALPFAVSGQNNNELLIEAYQLRKKGDLKESAEVIDQAVATKKGMIDTKAWHVRGFIYKDIYIKVDHSDNKSEAREVAVESFKKSIEFDANNDFTVQNRKVLKYLGISYFNNASDIIRDRDPATVEEANGYYEQYKSIMLYLNPDTIMTKNDIEFYLAMSTVLISFLMKSIIKLRIVNSVGCLLFVFYGVMLNPLSIPIVLTNAIILCINLYYIVAKRK